jgi:hypothetical protein
VGLIFIGFQEDLPPKDVATREPRCKVTQRFNLAFKIHPLVCAFLPATVPVPVKISEDIMSLLMRSVKGNANEAHSC